MSQVESARRGLLAPLPEAEWPDGMADEIAGAVLNIHRIVAHNPGLMSAYTPLRNYIVKGSQLTARQRELLILRTGHNMQSAYEWAHHVVRGRAAGLTDVEIERVKSGPDADGWSDEERVLLRTVDQMRAHQELDVETAEALLACVGSDGFMDAIYTIGVYLTLGTILKTFAVPLDESIQCLSD